MSEITRMLTLQRQLILLVIVGIFLWKKEIVSGEGKKCLTDLLIDVILPCNIIQSFRMEFSWQTLRSTLAIFVVSLVLQLGCALLCRFAYNRYGYAKKAVLQYGTVCSNAGFMGNSLAEGLFGSEGTLLASIYLIPQRIVMWSVGVTYFMADGQADTPEQKRARRLQVARKTITHPCIVAVLIGMVLMVTQLPLPAFLGNTVKSISNCTMAISMILIGLILGGGSWHNIITKDVLYYCAIRLFFIPLAVLVGCRLGGVDGMAAGVSIVLAAMPMGGTTAILAEKYGGDSVFAGKCVIVSTILSLITTPIWCLFV